MGMIYDLADDTAEDRGYDDWRQQQVDQEMREQMTEEALNEAFERGVSHDNLRILARETGCLRWALLKSLKG